MTVEPRDAAGTAADHRPLAGIRVLDIATFLAAPFAGTVLADFGADVIKIEQPRVGDPLRRFGTPTECGDTLVWLSEARNKRFLTLDLRVPAGKEVFLRLVEQSDVVLENFRPGTLERWGLGYDVLRARNPRLILLRVSAYGQTGPYAGKPGFARVAHGFGGLSHLSGMADGPPVVPGSTSLADYISGMWGVIGVLIALREVERGGEGQQIDVALYESVFRLLDELAPAYAKFGEIRGRLGPDVAHVVPHGHWRTRDDRWIALACSSDKLFERLARLMQRPDLSDPDRFATNAQRLAGRHELDAAIAEWVGSMTLEEVTAACDAASVPCGPILSIEHIFADPQYAQRGDLQTVDDPRVGTLVVPAALPKMSRTMPELNHLGAALGAHTTEILGSLLGLGQADIDRLQRDGAI
ncbi:MAG: CaiB/BaiF CoA-transferase family protein [Burkholderiaceae bacterium]